MSILSAAWEAVESALQHALLRLDDFVATLPVLDGWSWAVAVVLLTLGCRVLLLPTLLLQLRFLRRMDEVAPEIAAVKERHRVDLGQATTAPGTAAKAWATAWVRSEEEQDALLKAHGVRWYAGLLPALVQIPAVVAVLRVLASEERTRDLTPAGWSFVPAPTTSFFHSDQGRPLLGVLGALVVALVHLGQRRWLAASSETTTPTVRRVRLFLLPPLAGLLVLNLALTIVISVITSLLWGLGQSAWLAARRRASQPGPAGVGVTS